VKDNMKILVFKKKNCSPCENLSKDLEGVNLPLTFIDIENPDNLDICEEFNIKKVPTVIFTKDNIKLKQLNGRIDGSLSKELVIKTYNKFLGNE